MFIFLLTLSLVIFILGVAYAVRRKIQDRMPWQSFLLILLAVTAVSMAITVISLVGEGSGTYKVLYAAFYVMESAVGNVDYSLFSDALPPSSLWRIYTIFLHLLMPATAYAVILAYFLKAFGWFRYTIFRFGRQIILFSEMTDKSKAYAARINAKSTLMIFCNTPDGEKENFGEDSSRNMIFTDQSEIQVLKQLDKKNLTIMEMGEDYTRNVQRSVEIITFLTEECKLDSTALESIRIYTVSSDPEAATILDNKMGRGNDGKPLSIRQTVINEHKRIAFKLLHDAPLYKLTENGSGSLDIMIVGFGRMGQEVLKAVSWAGCFPDTDVNVHVISRRGIENGRRLLSECPELGTDLRHAGGFQKPENAEQLNPDAPIYYYSAETGTPGYDAIIRNLWQCRYIVISLDDDASTLAAAIRIYRMIKQEHLRTGSEESMPEIHVRIRDDESLDLFSTREDKSFFGQVKKFGSDDDIYSSDKVGESVLDHLAENIHKIYKEEHPEASDYADLPESDKNSNMAVALHVFYKLASFKKIDVREGVKDEKSEEWNRIAENNRKLFDELVSDAERLDSADREHIRWQAYERTEGYVHWPYEDIKKVFDRFYQQDTENAYGKTKSALREARIHPCIGDGDTHLKKIGLLATDQQDEYNFHKNDRQIISSIPRILGGYYELVKTEEE